ncbi:hypothetical protein SAMN05660199_03288 [Klenkia soli]|uniref:Uncharacterized protein n=1 Tax=Klenkia soli TaxID=1052260 RepID=A0A1H0QD03_9ACTN|nr:hypothetical protein [Klenkia soli]SDP15080.1 hypothetical protein SAMN05660199_03288 [Klenkia soli]
MTGIDPEGRAAWQAQIPGLRRFWEPVVARVLADVERTTSVDVTWSVELVEWQLDPEPSPGFWLNPGPQPLPVRDVPFPSLQLRLLHQWFDLRVLDDAEEAAAELAGVLQDYVIEELPGAWPVCEGHAHPMQSDRTEDGAVWRCPVDPAGTTAIGCLTTVG